MKLGHATVLELLNECTYKLDEGWLMWLNFAMEMEMEMSTLNQKCLEQRPSSERKDLQIGVEGQLAEK